MFGKNKTAKPFHDPDGALDLVGTPFKTIQGEGPFAGEPAIFVRLAGCNLKCFWCDTDFETNAQEWELDILLDSITKKTTEENLVVITGGEPLLQNISPLIVNLVSMNYRVQIETSGSVWPPGLDDVMNQWWSMVTIVCSPKTPKVHANILKHCKNYKYIITRGGNTKEDGLPAKSTQVPDKKALLYRALPSNTIWVQPCDEHNEAKNKDNLRAVKNIAMKFGYRVCLQLHKILGVE